MKTLNETRYVDCPYARAKEYLRETLEAETARGGQTLELNANLPGTGIRLAKEVHVNYARAQDPMHFDEPWLVEWSPGPGGIYPAFRGQLTVRATDTYRTAELELSGTYKPPMGAAGEVFDAAFGTKIASETAQNLLAAIASRMTDRYLREEASKK